VERHQLADVGVVFDHQDAGRRASLGSLASHYKRQSTRPNPFPRSATVLSQARHNAATGIQSIEV
jgi:hypothetical protein